MEGGCRTEHVCSAAAFNETAAVLFVFPSAVEGSAVQRTRRGNVFSIERKRRGYDPRKTMQTYEIVPAENKPLFRVSISDGDAR